MSVVSCFSVDDDLQQALQQLDDEFLGAEVVVGASADGDVEDEMATSSDDDDAPDGESEDNEEEEDVEQVAAGYFDGDEAVAEPGVAGGGADQGAAAPKNCGCRKNCMSKFDPALLSQKFAQFC